ncbi:response regulator [Candidatus Symbiobacter mobilis]|uniref:OmpR family response regulator n=1 Tax=Candidatus Symbiobacter mobilis CR TaxID=946483 RepID=U5N5I5_9BURK|nr:response regulator [Candidatus Symbiobacter mobilis]AGX86776.1 OmpR family response regulator [Candidatus Symbiobacter mobilis CR]
MKAAPSILLVEDEEAIAELLGVHLRHAGYRAVWARDGACAQARIEEAVPDAILLDWMLPGDSGLTWARRWRAQPRTRSVPILMLTARGEEADKVMGLDAGADDYIAKPFSMRELLARVRAVLRRAAPDDEEVRVVQGALLVDMAAHQATFEGRPMQLGPTEFRLLAHLAAHPGRAHSRASLLEHVWEGRRHLEERTVDVHIMRLREALGTHGAAMIETVRGVGYRFIGAQSSAS